MKKLTAGIFATILGLTAVDAFAAAAGTPVASTKYVDGAIQSLTVEKVGTSEATSYIKSVSETNGKISAESGTLATVATTGAYSDLTGIPADIVKTEDISNLATKTEVATAKSEAIAAAEEDAKKYIDETELTAKGYITNAALTGLATETYVDEAVEVEHDVNEQQAKQINALTTDMANYVKWTDVVEKYPTSN
jgi:hypothetical protein